MAIKNGDLEDYYPQYLKDVGRRGLKAHKRAIATKKEFDDNDMGRFYRPKRLSAEQLANREMGRKIGGGSYGDYFKGTGGTQGR
jgi:hypothetical protein